MSDDADMDDPHKMLIVGDGAIGKTCLISRMTNKVIDWKDEPDYEPTTFDNFIVEMEHPDGKGTLMAEVWDTAGQEAFEQLRLMSYPDTKIFMVGYSAICSASLSNVEEKWIPEITKQTQQTAAEDSPWIILVGTKCDLRQVYADKGDAASLVPLADAEAVARRIGACKWIETSAKQHQGVEGLQNGLSRLVYYKAEGKPKPSYDEGDKWGDDHWRPETEGSVEAQSQVKSPVEAATVPPQVPSTKQKAFEDGDDDVLCVMGKFAEGDDKQVVANAEGGSWWRSIRACCEARPEDSVGNSKGSMEVPSAPDQKDDAAEPSGGLTSCIKPRGKWT